MRRPPLDLLLICCLTILSACSGLTGAFTDFDEQASVGCSIGVPFAGICQISSGDWTELNINPTNFSSADFWRNNNPGGVLSASLLDNSSICYFLAIHLWSSLIGTETWKYRLLSLLFGLGTLVVSGVLARKLLPSAWTCRLSLLLLALHPVFLSASVYTRSHALALLTCMSATYYFHRVVFQGDWRAVANYALLSLTAMLTHLFSSYIILGHIFFMALFVRDRRTWTRFIVAGLGSALGFALWYAWVGHQGFHNLATVSAQFRARTDAWVPGDNPYYMPASSPKVLLGAATQVLLAQSGNILQDAGLRLSSLFPFAVVFWGWLLWAAIRASKESSANRFSTGFLCCLIAGYFCWGIVFSLRTNTILCFRAPYSVYITPFVCMLASLACEQSLRSSTRPRALFISLVCGHALIFATCFGIRYHLQERCDDYYARFAEHATQHPSQVLHHPHWKSAFLVNLHLRDHPEIPQVVDDPSLRTTPLAKIREF